MFWEVVQYWAEDILSDELLCICYAHADEFLKDL